MEVEYGYCHCGCGTKTKIAKRSYLSDKINKGEPYKFLRGHSARLGCLPYRKGITYSKGYRHIKIKYDHPRKDNRGYVPEHVLIVEKVIGKFLPVGSVPHHVNGIRDDNRNENLVLCQDKEYHFLLHVRKRAFENCGNPKWRKCAFCKKYDSIDNLYRIHSTNYHRKCRNEYVKNNT